MPGTFRETSEPGSIVLHVSRRRSLQTAFFALLVAAIASVFLFSAVLGHSLGTLEAGLMALVFLLGSLFVAVVSVLASMKTRTLTIAERGLVLGLSIDTPPWLVEWGEIREVFITYGPQFASPPHLAIVPKSRELFGRDRSSGERKLMEDDWKQHGAAVTVELNQFTRPEREVQDLLLDACRRHGVRVRADAPEDAESDS